jgi:tRNA/rRNA methyltransferase
MTDPHNPLDRDHLVVVLVETRNPLNLGAAARAMSNFGFPHLRVVRPYEPSFREARSAVGASELLAHAEEFATVAEAVADCAFVVGTTAARDRELQHPLHSLDAAGGLIRGHLQSGRVAILFGSEKRGLSNADLSHCHALLRIPTRAEHGSMNLGQAVAVCLYELVRADATLLPKQNATPATQSDLERLTQLLADILRASGYTPAGAEAPTEEKVRRLIRRLNLHSADAELVLGMLRQIGWKLRVGES